MEKLYPLRFSEIIRNYGFGDRWIPEVYKSKALPENQRIAETWEVVDRKNESSVVVNGLLAGKTLHQLIQTYGEELLGTDIVASCGVRFPLLIKFLDATNVLGEQAHHNDALAAKQGLDDPGKTEAWYMLKVREGASIHCGNKPGVTRSDVRKALIAGGIRNLMQEYIVQEGDAFLLHAGTMHYSKGGVLFYEIMQNSDVYIGLRKIDPELPEDEKDAKLQFLLEGVHIEEEFRPKISPVTFKEGENLRTFAFVCRYFTLERLDLCTEYTIECDGKRFFILTQIEGTSEIISNRQVEVMYLGNTCLLPANLGKVTIVPGKSCSLLKSYVPDLLVDVVKTCRAVGIADDVIVGLGGNTRLNTLRPLV
jgi:mannose-6-phosphate isomerase